VLTCFWKILEQIKKNLSNQEVIFATILSFEKQKLVKACLQMSGRTFYSKFLVIFLGAPDLVASAQPTCGLRARKYIKKANYFEAWKYRASIR